MDRPVVPVVELRERELFVRAHEPWGACPAGHDTSMPDRRSRLREISRVTAAAPGRFLPLSNGVATEAEHRGEARDMDERPPEGTRGCADGARVVTPWSQDRSSLDRTRRHGTSRQVRTEQIRPAERSLVAIGRDRSRRFRIPGGARLINWCCNGNRGVVPDFRDGHTADGLDTTTSPRSDRAAAAGARCAFGTRPSIVARLLELAVVNGRDAGLSRSR